MYHTMFRDPEMHGLFEFHPKGRFYARLEGLVHTVFSDQPDWNPYLIRHQAPVVGIQIMTEVQRSWTQENWCIARHFKPDLTVESDCWRLLKGILGSQLSGNVDQLEQLDLEPLLGSYCQVTVKHKKISPHKIMMQLGDFTPVLSTPMMESLFPEFEPSIFPDDEVIDESRELAAMEQSEIIQNGCSH